MSGDGRCQVEISITGHTSTLANWYEIWAAVAAITSMCTRMKGQGGKARGLGKCPHPGLIWLEALTHTLFEKQVRIGTSSSSYQTKLPLRLLL